MNNVERFQLAPGLEISRVLNGLWQVADSEKEGDTLDPELAARRMAPCVEAGFTTFDLADHYGSSELIAGCFNTNQPLSAKAQFLTKWVPQPGALRQEDVRQAVARALQRLRCERIDLLQFHAWHYPHPSWLDALFWLEELCSEGLVAHLGVTNFDAAHLRVALASGIPLVSNQVSYSLLDQRAAGDLTAVCQEFGVHLLAYGTLAGGFFSERWLDQPEPQDLSSWSQMKYKRFIDAAGGWAGFQQVLHTVNDVAEKHGVGVPAVASRYILDLPAVAGVILGNRLGPVDHIGDNFDIFSLELEASDRQRIAEAVDQLRPIPGDCGDEYRKPPFLTATGDLSDHLESIPAVFETESDTDNRSRVFSGTSWEAFAGYCRAVREGERILVSGTTAAHGERLIGGDDPAAQAHFVIDKIQAAIESLGGRLEDVVRTRIFVANIEDWEAVARAHGARFAHSPPVNTLVEARLVGSDYKVEIEAEAVCR